MTDHASRDPGGPLPDSQRSLQRALRDADVELVAAIERRADLARKLGALRAAEPPSPHPIEAEELALALQGASGVLDPAVLSELLQRVAAACVPLILDTRVVHAGPGSRDAAVTRFGEGEHHHSCDSIAAALGLVAEGQAGFAVVPYERRSAGLVDATLRGLMASELRIVACVELGPTPATGDAEGELECTRYAIVGPRPTRRSGRDLTAVVFAVRDEPGALHEVLAMLRERDVSVKRIHSRPRGRTGWDCLFFVEVVGHATDRNVVTALENVRRLADTFRVLGSYAEP